jgi:predicted aldo/keto reductase-like oxidoreductase
MLESKEQSARHDNFINGGFFDGIPSFASWCMEYGKCEEKCPQGFPIRPLERGYAVFREMGGVISKEAKNG